MNRLPGLSSLLKKAAQHKSRFVDEPGGTLTHLVGGAPQKNDYQKTVDEGEDKLASFQGEFSEGYFDGYSTKYISKEAGWKTNAGILTTGGITGGLIGANAFGDDEDEIAQRAIEEYKKKNPGLTIGGGSDKPALFSDKELGLLGKGFAAGAGGSSLYDMASNKDINLQRALALGIIGSGGMYAYDKYKNRENA